MIQDLYQEAMKYAGEKHKGQLVPSTAANYLLHIANVTMEVIMAHKEEPDFDLALAMQVAILHDTIEDTDATYEDLLDKFGSRVADGVLAKRRHETKTEDMAVIALAGQPVRL